MMYGPNKGPQLSFYMSPVIKNELLNLSYKLIKPLIR